MKNSDLTCLHVKRRKATTRSLRFLPEIRSGVKQRLALRTLVDHSGRAYHHVLHGRRSVHLLWVHKLLLDLSRHLLLQNSFLESLSVIRGERRLGGALLGIVKDLGGLRERLSQVLVFHASERVRLFHRVGPSHNDLAGAIVRWLPAMRDSEIVNAKHVSELPAVVDHVLVDSRADFVHLHGRNGCSIAKGRIETHLVSKQAILDHAKDGHEDAMKQQPQVVGPTEGKEEFHREGRPMEHLGMVEPDRFLQLDVNRSNGRTIVSLLLPSSLRRA